MQAGCEYCPCKSRVRRGGPASPGLRRRAIALAAFLAFPDQPEDDDQGCGADQGEREEGERRPVSVEMGELIFRQIGDKPAIAQGLAQEIVAHERQPKPKQLQSHDKLAVYALIGVDLTRHVVRRSSSSPTLEAYGLIRVSFSRLKASSSASNPGIFGTSRLEKKTPPDECPTGSESLRSVGVRSRRLLPRQPSRLGPWKRRWRSCAHTCPSSPTAWP